ANRLDAKVIEVDLNGQFRCAGSEAYLVWVQRLLGLIGDGPAPWDADPSFDLRLAGSPAQMESWLRGKLAEGDSTRLSAGFCWKWSDPEDGRLVDDVVIGDWRRP